MRKNSGFSVIELLVVIGMIAVICSIAIPNLIGWRQKAQLGKAARDVYGGFQKAKLAAIRSNRFCVFNFFNANHKGKQYMFHIFVDTDQDGVYDELPKADPNYEEWIGGYLQSDYPGVSLDTDYDDGITFAGNSMTFAPDGLPRKPDGTLTDGSLYYNDGSINGRQISVSPVGSIQISQYEANE